MLFYNANIMTMEGKGLGRIPRGWMRTEGNGIRAVGAMEALERIPGEEERDLRGRTVPAKSSSPDFWTPTATWESVRTAWVLRGTTTTRTPTPSPPICGPSTGSTPWSGAFPKPWPQG